jgi:hypothetical protein
MDFEKLGAFYLGKECDVQSGKLSDQLLLFDARDLTTHAVCVGMTGSGKTGLGIVLLEEAAIDHVPAIIIDPKGDIANRLLVFPEMRPEDFRPWINADDARRKQISEDGFAAQQAELWRNGMAQWGQSTTRTLLLRESADVVVYTPGSDAGVPVSILRSFAAPKLNWDDDAELLRELIQGTISALLGLIGGDTDPVRSREHILLANLFEHSWRRGEDLDLPKLIAAIQNPPLRQVGVFDVDTFFPEKDRFKLAMAINNLIAAPGFQSWLQGQPLDVASFLATPAGKPRHSIFYIAHLNDDERMFFVSVLLNQVIAWMRAQSGTNSLRALLYMDEIFGFFPPIANPPSKAPMLTLLKQARAFGLGIVLCTQNPVDLDYKGLANTGTWFIGRLRTEQDKRRLLDGLQSAAPMAERRPDWDVLSSTISNLQSRTFLLHSIYADAPVTFQTRWAMSYLRGPLTRVQIRQLMQGRQPDVGAAVPPARTPATTGRPAVTELAQAALDRAEAAPATPAPAPVVVEEAAPAPAVVEEEPAPPIAAEPLGGQRAPQEAPPAAPGRLLQAAPPNLPASVQEVYLPVRRTAEAARQAVQAEVRGQRVVYVAALLGIGTVDFVDQRKDVQEQERFSLLAPSGSIGRETWERAQPVELTPRDLADHPEAGAYFVKLPTTMDESPEFTGLKKALEDFLYANWFVSVFYSPALKVYSRPDESRRDFQMRLQQLAREKRDEELDEINDRYEAKLEKLDERLRRVEATIDRKDADARARSQEAWVSIGESIFGSLGGRRRSYRGLSTYMSKRRMAAQKKMEVQEAEDTLDALEAQIAELEEEGKQELEAARARWEEALQDLEEVPIKPRRTDVRVELFALAWVPHWGITLRTGEEVRTRLVPAF